MKKLFRSLLLASSLALLIPLSKSNANGEVMIRKMYGAPHGDKSVGTVYVLTDGDTIFDAYIDEFQFTDSNGDAKGVPSSDGEFAKGYADGKVLISKKENNDFYSKNMKEHADATHTILENYTAIEDFVKGKKISDLENELKDKGDKIVDEVTSSTLVDTKGYLELIAKAAKFDKLQSVGIKVDDPSKLELNVGLGAPHGDKSFAQVAVATDGKKIAAAHFDEFQFMDATNPLPNSDAGFAEGYADKALVSKRWNNEDYSKAMKEHADATQQIAEGYQNMEAYLAGKTKDEVEKDLEKSDAVSSATLVDQNNYVGFAIGLLK